MGMDPMIVSTKTPIDSNKPYEHRKVKVLETKLLSAVPTPSLFTADGEVNPFYPSFMYEKEMPHRKIYLDANSLAALNLLGVRPIAPSTSTASLEMSLDSRVFNHDVLIMRCAANFFIRAYNSPALSKNNRFKSLSPAYKIERFRRVLGYFRSVFPQGHKLTDSVDKSLDDYSLRQNHFWQGSVFIDSDFPKLNDGEKYTASYQLPFMRHRPLVPMTSNSEIYHAGKVLNYEDTLMCAMFMCAEPYTDHVLSGIDRFRKLYVGPKYVDNPSPRTRTYIEETIPKPIGNHYIPEVYVDSPMISTKWLYYGANEEIDPGDILYDIPEIISNGFTVEGRTVMGVGHSRSHKSVNKEVKWMIAEEAEGYTTVEPIILYSTPLLFKVNWVKQNKLIINSKNFEIPELVDFSLKTMTIDCYYTTPDNYVGNREEIYDEIITSTAIVPVLGKNMGPFISRLANRDLDWPANCDFTKPGAFTERIYPDKDENKSSEYNPNLIGVIPTRRKPVNITSPVFTLVPDAVASWDPDYVV